MNNYSEYTVKISSEPSYYGSDCTQADADRIVERLENLIRSEFPGINTENCAGGERSSKTTGPDETVIKIDCWIENNWTEACAEASCGAETENPERANAPG